MPYAYVFCVHMLFQIPHDQQKNMACVFLHLHDMSHVFLGSMWFMTTYVTCFFRGYVVYEKPHELQVHAT